MGVQEEEGREETTGGRKAQIKAAWLEVTRIKHIFFWAGSVYGFFSFLWRETYEEEKVLGVCGRLVGKIVFRAPDRTLLSQLVWYCQVDHRVRTCLCPGKSGGHWWVHGCLTFPTKDKGVLAGWVLPTRWRKERVRKTPSRKVSKGLEGEVGMHLTPHNFHQFSIHSWNYFLLSCKRPWHPPSNERLLLNPSSKEILSGLWGGMDHKTASRWHDGDPVSCPGRLLPRALKTPASLAFHLPYSWETKSGPKEFHILTRVAMAYWAEPRPQHSRQAAWPHSWADLGSCRCPGPMPSHPFLSPLSPALLTQVYELAQVPSKLATKVYPGLSFFLWCFLLPFQHLHKLAPPPRSHFPYRWLTLHLWLS